MALREYRRKRDFANSPEPMGKVDGSGSVYCIQKHDASRLHYDLRLQVGGVLKSWAVPKGPSLDPKIKRLAVQVEDHPLDYATFEGRIPDGYGAGDVIVWDYGTWKPVQNARTGLKSGRLIFDLYGDKLHGRWALIRTRGSVGKPQWLLMKTQDAEAMPETEFSITEREKESVLSDRSLPRDLPFIEPQLARLEKKPPEGAEWVHEVKFDGYRTLCRIENGKARLLTRTGLDWTKKYTSIQKVVERLGIKNAWLDGEIVCLDENGRSDFQLLQESIKSPNPNLIFYVFDLLALGKRDLREEPLRRRKEKLREIIQRSKSPHVRYSDHWATSGQEVLGACCRLGLEGVVSKRQDAPYVSGRAGSWIKTKCGKGQEFVIVGYTSPKRSRAGFGALLMAAKDRRGNLTYAGRVGTGFNRSTVVDLMKRFKPLKRRDSPLEPSGPKAQHIQWLTPDLVADVRFLGWTREKILRHATFHGLRLDKPAAAVRFEELGSDTIRLSHPDKILIPGLDITKGEIGRYYEIAEKWMLPHVHDRPLALVRCPDGIRKQCFFQKHLTNPVSNLHQQPEKGLDGKRVNYIYVDSLAGIESLVQLGVLEVHVWGTHRQNFLQPDQIVFDLDPGEGIDWEQVIDAAVDLRKILKQLKLKAFVKFTGGKGLHIQTPIKPDHDWNTIKAFTRAIAQHLTQQSPKLYVFNMAKAKRKNRIFIDYLRNGYGATAIAPYSLRARDSAGVALPISWAELGDFDPTAVNIRTVQKRLKSNPSDPWKDYFKIEQTLTLDGLP